MDGREPLGPAGARPALVVVDGANVVGSVPDGWWRDRRGAAERLRDRLALLTSTGLAGHPGPVEIVLVVEGAARGVESAPGVRVDSAPRSGDDRIVELVRDEATGCGRPAGGVSGSQGGRAVVVVTADRELRARVEAYGARCVGPRTVRG
ncbi:NTP pyrophosphohydrolase [Streptomyces sp. MUM 178J]|uniref:NTP pyrophosphohydrolase n=1 Tax=Streptomyces sp. MUM 178J TaxID=2791991 RepID=UPI001F04CC25|nr:NTP pyrophosphohydrolase [Streptomyces sp. MUM 178J]WRQ80510.1 NTP pyrophosphohydrolase [Streptomyces sp. MUM 178J]